MCYVSSCPILSARPNVLTHGVRRHNYVLHRRARTVGPSRTRQFWAQGPGNVIDAVSTGYLSVLVRGEKGRGSLYTTNNAAPVCVCIHRMRIFIGGGQRGNCINTFSDVSGVFQHQCNFLIQEISEGDLHRLRRCVQFRSRGWQYPGDGARGHPHARRIHLLTKSRHG